MRRKKILLTAIDAKYIHSNLAVYSLKANAGKYEDQVEIAEYTINHRREEILRGIYRHSPDVVAFSCYIWNIRYVLDLAADLRNVLPEVLIVLGGPEVSYDAPAVLERYSFVDLVIVGEGELTFRKFLECYLEQEDVSGEPYRHIPGICVRSGGEIRMTPPGPPVDLDELVFPYRDLAGMENRILYYETMRGCPFSCSYCLSSIEKGIRMRSLPLVYEEIQFFLDHRVKQVKFVDRTFNCRHEHAYLIWEYIGEHDNGTTNFHFEIGGDLLREEDFELFRKFRPGLIQFEIGVQSTNPDTIRAIHRKMDIGKLAVNLSKVRANRNIHQHLDLIAGLPYEDYASFKRSFQDVYAMAPDQLQLGFLKVLKGSGMKEDQEQYGIKYGNQPPYEVLSTRWMTYDDICRLKRVEEMVEIYYNSFQFQATMVLLEMCHDDAFSLFERIGDYWERRGWFEMQHSRKARYEMLWDYVNEYCVQWREAFRQTLTYDLYLREYTKSPPAFVQGRQKKDLRFTLDMQILLEEKRVQETEPYSLVFDYQKRDPLSHNATVCRSE